MAKKKDYKNLEKKDLVEGKILPIYEDYKDNKVLMGYAKLLEFKEQGDTFEFTTVGTHLIIYEYQRWLIEFVDPKDYNPNIDSKERWKYLNQKGFKTIKKISYFVTVDSNYTS